METLEDKYGINSSFLPPLSLIFLLETLLPEKPKSSKGGRPRVSDERLFVAIWYVLRTGIQWKALPRQLAASSTAHDRFQEWARLGVFQQLWELGLMETLSEERLQMEWMSVDGCMTKAPLGQESTGANPTDRGKTGVKRHILTDEGGLPVSLTVTGANVPDCLQIEQVLDGIPDFLPDSLPDEPQNICADKGYDSKAVRHAMRSRNFEAHVRSRKEEKQDKEQCPNYRARRWVCERTHSWLNRFRRLLIRWEKKVQNYLAFLQLACAHIVWRNTTVFG